MKDRFSLTHRVRFVSQASHALPVWAGKVISSILPHAQL